MKYRPSKRGFGLEPMPLSSGALASVLTYRQPDVANLFAELESVLFDQPKVRASRLWFTLVNVTCTHTGFSYGLCDSPPKAAQPIACTWLFTFALTPQRYELGQEPSYTSLRGINCRMWGFEGSQFLTIGVTHRQAQEFALSYDMQTVHRIYYLLGCMTKHRELQWVPTDTYADRYAKYPLERAYNQFYMKPLHVMLGSTPLLYWVYNRHVWRTATHLIGAKQITPETLMYRAMYLDSCKQLPDVSEAKALDVLHEAFTSTLSRYDQGTPAQTVNDLLFTAFYNQDALYNFEGSVAEMIEFLETKDYDQMASGLKVTNSSTYFKELLYGSHK